MGKPLVTITDEDFDKLSRPENYDPDKNALPLYKSIVDDFVNIPKEVHKILDENTNVSDLNDISEWIRNTQRQLKIAEEAAERPYCFIQWSDYGKFEEFGVMWIGRTFINRSLLELRNGQIINACEDIVTCHKIGCQFIILDPLVSIIIRDNAICTAFKILEKNFDNSDAIFFLENYFQNFLNHDKPVFSFEYQRLNSIKTIQESYTDNGKGNGHLIPYWPSDDMLGLFYPKKEINVRSFLIYIQNFCRALTAPSKKEAIEEVEYYYRYLSTLAKQSPWENHIKMEKPQDVQIKLQKKNPEIEYFLWDVERTVENYVNRGHLYKAREEGLCVVLKILKYNLEQRQLPGTLEDLVKKGYLKELPSDPYSDKILIYKKVGDSFLLYSVGLDFDDDNGKMEYDVGSNDGDLIFWPVTRKKEK